MPLFGFAINFKAGDTAYALVSAENETEAEVAILHRCGGSLVDTIVGYDGAAEVVVREQFGGIAFLSTEMGD